jgi:ribosomal protein S18 acetylase RimI-like enzyme
VIEHRTCHRRDVGTLLVAMSEWPHPARPAAGLHIGDLGWHLRLDDDAIDGAFHGWWEGADLLAVALVEGVVGRYAVRPGHERDAALAEHLAENAGSLVGDEVYADVRPETTARQLLVAEGWHLDPDPWVALHRDLTDWVPATRLADVAVAEAADSVPDRVAVQRAGFERSTFTEATWQRMAAGPGYRPDLDVVVRDGQGTPAAIATAWFAGPGATAILEPVATHPDLRGQGWGRSAVTVLLARLRDLGASGVTVCTPADYTSAIATYRSAGLRPIETLQSLMLDRTGQSTA